VTTKNHYKKVTEVQKSTSIICTPLFLIIFGVFA